MNDFKVIGISTVTTNENGKSIEDVEKIWGKFWGENIAEKIPNKASDEIYAVYTDYENGNAGQYTLIIGFPVTTLQYPARLCRKGYISWQEQKIHIKRENARGNRENLDRDMARPRTKKGVPC